MSDKHVDQATGTETTGHEWDGIQELNTPLPRWWLWTFYITIVWGVGYSIAYPAWPMISGATEGLLGYSTRGELSKDVADHEAKNVHLVESLLAADLNTLSPQDAIHKYAVARGASVFAAQCSQCHGSGAQGSVGFPNLLDDDWLWGGSIAEISYSVRHGIRNETDDEARWSEMPAFGEFLEDQEIEALADYIPTLANADPYHPGATLFADNCASCHGEAGLGDREQGAPNLADAIWLYGGDRDSLITSISEARFGVMPAWGQRLSEENVRAVSAYVHSLGGGE